MVRDRPLLANFPLTVPKSAVSRFRSAVRYAEVTWPEMAVSLDHEDRGVSQDSPKGLQGPTAHDEVTGHGVPRSLVPAQPGLGQRQIGQDVAQIGAHGVVVQEATPTLANRLADQPLVSLGLLPA